MKPPSLSIGVRRLVTETPASVKAVDPDQRRGGCLAGARAEQRPAGSGLKYARPPVVPQGTLVPRHWR